MNRAATLGEVRRLALIVLAAAAFAAGCGSDEPSAPAPAPTSPPATPADAATGLQVPWGIAFLPDGRALVSERETGRILSIPPGGGEPRVEMSVPGVDPDAGEGGLLGIALSPGYADDGLVYAYLTTVDDNRIVRFRLGEEPEPILTGLARGQIHNGGRIAFGPDGQLYAGVGDTGDLSLPQDPESLNGKILRMEPGRRRSRSTTPRAPWCGRSGTATSRASPGTPRAALGHRVRPERRSTRST